MTCHFRFADGETASASVSVHSPEAEAAVSYSGASDRLPDRFPTADAAFLHAWADQVAAKVCARLTITEAGQYDFWAE
ncbi:MAG: hypothetical protein AB9869_00620 [Verrucomicrobiia bacterium]